MGPVSWEYFQGPLTKGLAQPLISFGGIGLLSMEDCAPSAFLKNWVLVVPYLCFRFCIFDRPVLDEYVFQVEGGPCLLQSCLCVAQNGFPLTIKEMHPFKKI
jgi:hypothetical protein